MSDTNHAAELATPEPADSTASAAFAERRTEFTGFINFCESTTPEGLRITPGETLHLRGARNTNQWATGNNLIDGIEQNVVDLNLALRQGSGVAHLEGTLTPAAVDATWQIRMTVKIREGVQVSAQGVGHGTGDLHGMTMQFAADPQTQTASICSSMPAVAVKGIIIAPAASD